MRPMMFRVFTILFVNKDQAPLAVFFLLDMRELHTLG